MFSGTPGSIGPQTLSIATTSGTAPLTLTATCSPCGGTNVPWLVVSPTTLNATTFPQTVFVSVSGVSLPTGPYSGSIQISGAGVNTVSIPVSLNVGTGGGTGLSNFTSSPASISQNATVGSGLQTQTIQLSTSNPGGAAVSAMPRLTNGTGWLSVNPATGINIPGGSTVPLIVTLSPGTMPAGTYTGFIDITQNGSTTPGLSIPVTLNLGTTNNALTANPAQLNFSLPGNTTQPVTMPLTITTTSNTVENVTITPSVSSGSGWLSVTSGSVNVAAGISATINVKVDPTSLSTGQSYQGNIALTTPDLGTVNVPVVVTVGTSNSPLVANPNPLTLTVPSNSNAPVSQPLTVSTTLASVTFTAQATLPSGQTWLSVNPPTATATSVQPAALTVTANPTGLTPGMYTGMITLTPTNGGSPVTIQVTINVGGAASLQLSPGMLSFAYQTGTAFPPAQTIALTSNGQALPFTVTASTQSGGSWLVVTPQAGATNAAGGSPANLSVQVNASSLPAGSYQGSITIASQGASNSPQTIPVTLLVSNQPIVEISSNVVAFNYQFQSTTVPSQQQVQILSSGNPLPFTASVSPGSGGNWLMVTPANGTTPQPINLSLNPAVLSTLAPGTYNSTVTLSSNAAGNSPVVINVSLVIGNTTLLNVSQTSLNFNYQIAQALPVTQTFTVNSSGTPVNYTVAASGTNCNMNFLTANPSTGTTPGTVAVGVNVAGLVAGTCNGQITITSSTPGVGNSPLVIPVTVQVSNTPLLNVSVGAVNVTAQTGTSPVNQTIALTSTDPNTPINFTVTSSTNTGSGWLLVGPTSGATPTNLTVGFQTSGLAPGTYTGSINVLPTTPGAMATVIPVSVVVTSGTTLSATPGSLTFMQPFSGPAPASQTLQIVSTTPGVTFSASAATLSGGNWLSVAPSGGATPGTLTVTANGGNLGQGSYQGVITVVAPGAANSPFNINVTLNIGPPQSLTLSANTANFTYMAGSGSTVAPQTIQLTSTTGNTPFTTTVTSSTTGLFTVSPSSGTTPAAISVGVNPAVLNGLMAGTYTGMVTIAGANTSQTINLSIQVTPGAVITIANVVNGASNLPGPVAPGEIIAIFGNNVGPSGAPAGLTLTPSGMVGTTLSGTVVTFDNVPAPLIYVSNGQINAIVPYEIAGRVSTTMVITRNGVSSAPVSLQVAATVPAIFSATQTGSGQGAILNANSSYNSATNPATRGTVVQIFGTGEGTVVPSAATGSVTPATAPFPRPAGAVSLTIGGQPAQVVYAGEAPGLVSGVLQVNAIVPTGIGTGPQTVVLTVGTGTNMTTQIITVAVQ